jgi:hypothetical protein
MGKRSGRAYTRWAKLSDAGVRCIMELENLAFRHEYRGQRDLAGRAMEAREALRLWLGFGRGAA